jgi:hypothetical protein
MGVPAQGRHRRVPRRGRRGARLGWNHPAASPQDRTQKEGGHEEQGDPEPEPGVAATKRELVHLPEGGYQVGPWHPYARNWTAGAFPVHPVS